jgi:hypothetical protein
VIDYDGRRFRGHAPDAPVAMYHQDGDVVWSEWSGGHVRRGSLAGTCDAGGTVSFAYCMVLTDGAVISGHSVNTPEFLPDGRIRLNERWERFGAHAASGTSSIEEVAG